MSIYESDYVQKIITYSQEAYLWAEENVIIRKAVDSIVEKIKNEISLSSEQHNKKIDSLYMMITNEIKKFLFTYEKTELMIALLAIKALLRSKISNSDEKNQDYELSIRHEEILQLIHLILTSKESEFKNKDLVNVKNLAMSFRLGYYYNVLVDNIEHFFLQKNYRDPFDINIFFKEGAFYTNEYNEYMDDLLLISEMENPDDTYIQTLSIKQLMENKGVSKGQIIDDIDNIIQKYFGFSLSNLNNFIFWGLRQKPEEFLIIKDRDEYYKLIEHELNGSYSAFQNIIKTFSLNNILLMKKSLNPARYIELRSIYEIKNTVIFYPFDFIFNYSCFEKFMLKKHFVEYYTTLLDEDKQIEFEKELNKNEGKISTYLAYVIIDKLHTNGYKLPLKNGCPYPEVKSIVVNNTINLLKRNKEDKGDIDVLALDERKKEIYNIEIKYYKPLHYLSEIGAINKVEEREKNVVTPKIREQILINNIRDVVAFLGGNIEEWDKYTVRTMFVTPRPDYWLSTDNKGVEYYTWVDFINKVNDRSL